MNTEQKRLVTWVRKNIGQGNPSYIIEDMLIKLQNRKMTRKEYLALTKWLKVSLGEKGGKRYRRPHKPKLRIKSKPVKRL